MRRFSALALTLLLAFSVVGCTANKSAVVDPTRLFQESASGKAGIDHLKQLEGAIQEQLESAQKMLEKSPNDDALRAQFQKTFMGYQQLVSAEQQKVVESINELMQKTLDDYRVKKGYAVIMNSDGLLSFDPKSDVTTEVIEAMNATPLTFEPVKLDNLGAEKTAPAAKGKAASDAPKASDADASKK